MKALRILLIVLSTAAAGHVFAQTSQEAFGVFGPAAEPCFATFTSGSGGYFWKFCITRTGNVVKWEAPTGVEHVAVGSVGEGYAICRAQDETDPSEFTTLWDNGSDEDFGGTVSIRQPNGANTLPLTITRRTTYLGHAVDFVQSFTRNTTDQSLTIMMRLINHSTTTLPNIQMSRFVDFDIAGDHGDDLAANSADAVVGYETGGRGLMLRTTTLALDKPHRAGWVGYLTLTSRGMPSGYTDCRVTPREHAQGDLGGMIGFSVGDILPGRYKTVHVVYQRF